MREQTFSGPWLEVWTLTILEKKPHFVERNVRGKMIQKRTM